MIEAVADWGGFVTMSIVMPYVSIYEHWLSYFGNPPTMAPLPRGRAGFLRILRTGLLPASTERDEAIGGRIVAQRRKVERWLRRLGLVCGACVAWSIGLVAWDALSPLVPLVLAIAYAPVPRLTRREVRRRLARYDRLEAALDERRRLGPPPPPPSQPAPSPPPTDLRRPGPVEHPDRRRSERGRWGAGPEPT